MSIKEISDSIRDIVVKYGVKNISVFGSYADGTANEDSDVDLLVEFVKENVSLIELYLMQEEISAKLSKEVDLIHGPLQKGSLIVVKKVVDLYDQ